MFGAVEDSSQDFQSLSGSDAHGRGLQGTAKPSAYNLRVLRTPTSRDSLKSSTAGEVAKENSQEPRIKHSSRKRARNYFPNNIGAPKRTNPNLSHLYSLVDKDSFAARIAQILHGLCEANHDYCGQDLSRAETVFKDDPLPELLTPLVFRLAQWTNSTRAELITSLVLLDRLQASSQVSITYDTIDRCLITCMLLATKSNFDNAVWNVDALQFGVLRDVQTINELERRYLELTNWSVAVSFEKYREYEDAVMQELVNVIEPSIIPDGYESDTSQHHFQINPKSGVRPAVVQQSLKKQRRNKLYDH